MNEQQPYRPPQTPPPYNPGGGGSQRPTWRFPQTPPRPVGGCDFPSPSGNGYPGNGQPWQPYAPGQHKSNGPGIAGFVLSLVSIFIGWVPLIGWLIWMLSAIFSFIGLFRQPRGLAIAGIIISLVLIPMIITLLVALDAFTSAMFLV